MSDIKQIQLSGEALTSLNNFKSGGSKRKTRKVGGLPIRALEEKSFEQKPVVEEIKLIRSPHENNVPNQIKQQYQNEIINEKPIQIKKEEIKIVLAPKKKKETRVILSRKRKNNILNNSKIIIGGSLSKNKTRKVSLNLLKHNKKLTRAKKIFDDSNKLTIDKIKKQLISKNIIKPASKAPESVLRQIYNDALLVANKAF
jgi:hypothetical protein